MIRLDIAEQGRIRTVDLDDGSHLIGRAMDADLRLESAEVSRRHAVLEVGDDGVWVRDLGSLWGTFVGAQRLEEGHRTPLAADQLLRVAQVELWPHGTARPQLPRLSGVDPDTTGLHERLRVNLSDVTDLPRKRTLPMLRHLFHLFTLDEEGQAIEQEACQFVRSWVDVDRVCLFETVEPGVAPEIRGWWSRDPLDPAQLFISERMVREVLDTGEAVIWAKDPWSEDLDPKSSLHRFGIQSAMAVPVLRKPAVRGVLYADRRSALGEFHDEDLEVLVATASAVATRRAECRGRFEAREAARIQRLMLPHALPSIPGYQLDAGLHMCHDVGGDLYDCIGRDDGHWLLAIGDVEDKGLPAALMMGATSFLLSAYAEFEVSPLEIYSRLHRNLVTRNRARQFVALFLGELDPGSGVLRCVVAGLPKPLVIRPDGRLVEIEPTARPVAMPDVGGDPPFESRIVLEPGDLLAVFTDGYPEATPDHQRWLEAEVAEHLVQNRHLALADIRDSLDRCVDAFVGAAGPSDDRAILLLRRDAA